MLLLGLAAVLVFCCSGKASLAATAAPQGNHGAHLRLQAGSFDPTQNTPPFPAELRGQAGPKEEDYYVVQFRGSVLPEWRDNLELLGAKLHGYMADHAYVVRMSRSLASDVRHLPEVRWVGWYEPGYRMSPGLWDRLRANSEVVISIATFEPQEMEAVEDALHSQGGLVTSVSSGGRGVVRAKARGLALPRLAQVTGVAWIEEYVPHELFNDQATDIVHADSIWVTPGLSGAGQTVAVADTGLDLGVNDSSMHPDFQGRIVEGEALGRATWDDPDGHGTHVAGSVLGDGTASSSTYSGVAPEASLVMQSVLDADNGLGGIPADLRTLFSSAYDAGARIHTNSWGANVNGAYTTDSWNVDRFAWDHRDVTILFAAGNAGKDKNKDGVVDPDSLAAPGTAKNCITVAASENNRPTFNYVWGSTNYGNPIATDLMANNTSGMAAWSSRGPTDDGRMKPDLTAPGTWVCSTRTHKRAVDEGFEPGLPADWTFETGWYQRSAAAHQGSYGIAQGTLSSSYANNLDSWVMLPALDLRSYYHDWIEIAIWTKFNIENNKDTGFLLIEDQTDPGIWYTDSVSGVYTGNQSTWALKTVSIDPGRVIDWSSIHIALALQTDGSNAPAGAPYYWFVDDVRVYSLPGWRPAEVGLSTDGTTIDENYQLMSGTSMATPLTAGGVALLRQHYVDDEGLTDPSSALIKATLVATADDMTPGQYGTGTTQEIKAPPDRAQGWGRLNLKKAIAPDSPASVLYSDIELGLGQGDSESFAIEVTDNSVPLRVVLAWTDPAPASPSVTPQLVNDLDLTVTDPALVEHKARADAGDHLNNVELVELLTPATGTYTITVAGYDVNGADQPYALVIFGAAQETQLPPELSSVTPATGAQGVMNLNVQIVGLHTNFADGVSVASFSGTGITVNRTTVVDATHVTANICVDLSAPLGSRDVTVTTGDEVVTGTAMFEVTVSTISVSVSPGGWDIGAAGAGAVFTTWTTGTPAQGGYFRVRNDGTSSASLMIGTASSESWAPGSEPGPDTFVVGCGQTQSVGTEPAYTVMTTSGVPLVSSLSPGGGFSFDLQCRAPTSSTDSSQQHLRVIIGAQP